MFSGQLVDLIGVEGVIALDVLPALEGALVGLGGVGANGFQGFDIGDAQGGGDAAGNELALVVSALGQFAAMQGHGGYHVDAVKEMTAGHVTHRAASEPVTHAG